MLEALILKIHISILVLCIVLWVMEVASKEVKQNANYELDVLIIYLNFAIFCVLVGSSAGYSSNIQNEFAIPCHSKKLRMAVT